LSKQRKLTRGEAIAIAQAARKLPEGMNSDRVHLQLSSPSSAQIRQQNPAERGSTYELGLAFEAGGYLLLYDLIEALGGRIITTIIDSEVTILTRHKSYTGKNQADLLLQIIRDRLQVVKEKENEEN